MPTVIEVVKRLLPQGTLPERSPDWEHPPFWPPDVFAVSATLIDINGGYSRPRYTAHWSPDCLFQNNYCDKIYKVAEQWGRAEKRRKETLPRRVTQLWHELLRYGPEQVVHREAPWLDAAMELVSLADEASTGMGFLHSEDNSYFAEYLYFVHWHQYMLKRPPRRFDLPNLPVSLCWMVPPSEVCVQPKTRTPQVGCTVRSLSHNLALLPSTGQIKTSWLFAFPAGQSLEPLNLLLVPFPYDVDGSCFVAEPADERSGFFQLKQNWLTGGRARLNESGLARFLEDLVKRAKYEVRHVDGLILPESALSHSQAVTIARRLAAQTEVELFISGVSQAATGSGFPRNQVFTAILHDRRILGQWTQSKHHRWKLDSPQIRRYHLGDALDPEREWWEKIELQERNCAFYVFRYGASLAALVCEDLARIDPAQIALRAVGPNLVVVLLMDGPQLERRWPGRYATVLADDPGSAVLTLTSLGMVRRSIMPGEDQPCQIALWKDPFGEARELKLPKGSHALLLTLSQSSEKENIALDGRSDGGTTVRLQLSGVRDIRLSDAAFS